MTALDVTDGTFETDVLERSDTAPVIVDLWAPWCGPCRSLGPIIEQVVDATAGAAVLAKVNIDENPRVSATFQVQSIPAVFAIHRRQVVDRFIGALPENKVKVFVDGVIARAQPSEAERLIELGDEASLRKAVELEPGNDRGITCLASLLVERGEHRDDEEALSLLERIPETAETRRIAALARTRGGAAVLGSEDVSQAAPGSPAEEPRSDGRLDAHLDELLGRLPGDDQARQEIVDLIETMQDGDPRREKYRRALSAKLF
ncbi:MAG: thioredoxin domain-containing protein [Acidimicrobiales bacterium]